jgi:prolyl-tRNA synthetase
MAEAVAPGPRAAAAEALRRIDTPTQKTCEAVAELMGIALTRTVKSVALIGEQGFVLALVRGDHVVNEIKLAKLGGLAAYRLATEAEILDHLGSEPGFLGPVQPRKQVYVLADRTVAAMADMIVGANEKGFHLAGVNWGRDLPEPDLVADIRNAVEGDPSPDGQGKLGIARGIEVGHVFQLGQKYAEAMHATVLDQDGKAQTMYMGCYGIGISRIVAAAIEQNFDDNGIVWPEPMAPWRVAVCVINPKGDATVAEAAQALYDELNARGIEACLDDRGLRPGQMFADIELLGIPHRVVVSERGLAAGSFEYRGRRDAESRNLARDEVFAQLC